MNAEQLQTFEQLAHSATKGTGDEARKAQDALAIFSSQVELTAQLKFVLDNAQTLNAKTYAASCLNKMIAWHWNSYSIQTRVDIRNYVLNVLAERGPSLQHVLIQQLLSILAKITKLGWFDDDDSIHQKTVDQVTSFFRPDSPQHSLIGLAILIRLLEEIGSMSPPLTLTQHRKISIAFRDQCLLKIFKLSLTTLRAIDSENISDAEKQVSSKICHLGLRLALLCLTFDFVGTSPSESTEDSAVLKIPNSWKPLFDEGDGTALLDLFWNMFNGTEDQNRELAMEIIVELSSVRRSLFDDDKERGRHLARLMNGITDVLVSWQADQTILEDEQTLHHFCRLLARLKGNYQLTQIVNSESYSDWIRLVAAFSLRQDWTEHANSLFYVMMLWSRLVAAIPYLDSTRSKAQTSGLLEEYAPKILDVFVKTRIEAVALQVDDDPNGDPLPVEDVEGLLHMDALPHMGRLKYTVTADKINAQLATALDNYTNSQPRTPLRSLAEGHLALLVLVISGIVGGRGNNSSSNTELHNEIDALLTARVMKIMQLHDENLQPGNLTEATKRLELALLSFLQEFRKVYVGDPSLGTTRMFEKLAEIVGINDSNTMLTLIMRKIVLNLRHWANFSEVIDNVTQLFYEMVTGYASIRLVVKLDATNEILANHTSQNFPFLDVSGNDRNRVRFYTTLSKLLYMKTDGVSNSDNSASPTAMFLEFVSPFSTNLAMLQQQMSTGDMNTLRTTAAKQLLVGALLDLRGFCHGIYSRRAYERFFDWLYPEFMPALHGAVQVWIDTPSVMHPLLKFWLEFVTNRSGRVVFDCSSANGILLFKETSKFLSALGEGLKTLPDVPQQDLYSARYKSITLSMNVLVAALSGNYCNFGVFKLYNDSALTDAISINFELSLAIPLDHILEYPKLTGAYYAFIERVLAHHIEYACMLDRDRFRSLLLSLEHGLTYSEVAISSACCGGLDNLATYADKYRQGNDKPDSWQALIEHIEALQSEFVSAFRSLLHYALFDDCPNQWSCSRPLFSLAIMLPGALDGYSERLIAQQAGENQAKLAESFSRLLSDVAPNLGSKTRDQFTQNFQQFKANIRTFVTTEATI